MMQNLVKQAGAVVAIGVLTCWQIGSAYAQDNQAIEMLSEMSAELASLDRFVVTGDGYIDAGLGAGQIVERNPGTVYLIPNRCLRPWFQSS